VAPCVPECLLYAVLTSPAPAFKPVPSRAVFVYLSLMHSSIRAKRSSGGIPAPAAAAASSAAAGHDEVEASSVAKQALLRAMAGRPQGRTPANVTSAEIMRVTALVEELREPINNVAEVLSIVQPPPNAPFPPSPTDACNLFLSLQSLCVPTHCRFRPLLNDIFPKV